MWRKPPLAAPAPVAAKRPVSHATRYPNPTEGAATVAYTLSVTQHEGRLQLFTALGTPVAALDLPGSSGTVALPLTGLRGGVYYFTILVDGRPVQTGKLVKL